MSLEELRIYLASIGDGIASHSNPNSHGIGGEIMTEKGTRYVSSNEGTSYDGQRWAPKVRWNRWT